MQECFLFDKWVYYTQVFVPLLGIFPLFIYLFIYLLYQNFVVGGRAIIHKRT
jgi:hypothetical protein